MATTLVQAWQQQRDAHAAAHGGAQTALTASQATLAAARAQLDADTAALHALGTTIAARRRALAEAAVPADAQTLTLAIRDAIVQHRTLQGRILDDQDAAAQAQAESDATAAALERAGTQLANAEAALAAATAAEVTRLAQQAELAIAPLDTLVADVTALVGGQVAADAQAAIDASFPASLQTLAGRRFDNWRTRLTALRDARDEAEVALGDAVAAADGLAGVAARRSIDYARARRRLDEFVSSAAQRRDRAEAVLLDLQARSAGTLPGLLSASELVAVADDPARTAAATAAGTVDTARAAAVTAQGALDDAILTAIAADVDTLGTDAAVAAARAALTTATQGLTAATTALGASGDRLALDEWQAVVRDSAWSALVDFLEAQETLAELQGVVYSGAPGALIDALDAAEDAYAVALLAAAKAERTAAATADALARRAARATAAANAQTGRLLSAVRGDGA